MIPLRSTRAGEPAMEDLLNFYISELQDRIDRLSAAWRHGDEQMLQRIAHQLAGASEGYGYEPIAQSASMLEHTLRDEADVALITERLEDLIRLCRRARAAA
jgi:HPt (histidine-containing phosphotransfer) domain-containing protein